MDSEKITINIGAMDLGQIDLLVEQGFYSNRTDFIRMAIRSQINLHNSDIEHMKTSSLFGIEILDQELKKVNKLIETEIPKSMIDSSFSGVGVFALNKKALEEIKSRGNKIDIKMMGILMVTKDVTPELVEETINSVKVFGMIKASEGVKKLMEKKKVV